PPRQPQRAGAAGRLGGRGADAEGLRGADPPRRRRHRRRGVPALLAAQRVVQAARLDPALEVLVRLRRPRRRTGEIAHDRLLAVLLLDLRRRAVHVLLHLVGRRQRAHDHPAVTHLLLQLRLGCGARSLREYGGGNERSDQSHDRGDATSHWRLLAYPTPVRRATTHVEIRPRRDSAPAAVMPATSGPG